MVIFDLYHGIFALDIKKNVIYKLTGQNIFGQLSTYDGFHCRIRAVATKQTQQIHVFAANQHVSFSVNDLVNCLCLNVPCDTFFKQNISQV